MSACRVLACALIACFLLTPLMVKPGKAFIGNPLPGSSEPSAPQERKAIRRALLVGIEDYEHNPDFQPTRCQDSISRKTPRRKSSTAKGGFISLEGSMNDVCAVRQLLIARYGFETRNIHIVANQEATREGILSAFKRYLIDEADPDGRDVSFFFYSGHGSQVKNTLGGEADQLDETLVPIDWKRPITKREDAKDIRDKEIFKLFRDAAKKVTLTALFDSCHSGGVSRGGIKEGRSKTGPAELQFDFAQPPPDKDQEGLSEQEYLERNGVLVISAARDNQEAQENEYNDKVHGNFTYALLEVLQSPNADNLSAARIFDKLVVQMKSHNDPHEPVIVGSAARRRQTLFGEPVDPSKRPEVNVESVDGQGRVTLQGGRALGLNEGCEFVMKGDEVKANGLRIRIIEKPDYVKSFAEVIADNTAAKLRIAATIKRNTTFVLEKWAAAGEPNLLVWIPNAKLTAAQLTAAAHEIAKLGESTRVQMVVDPTVDVATHFLSHDGKDWLLKLPANQTIIVGPLLTAKAVLDKLPASDGKVKLFYSLPPSMELAAQIKLGKGTANSAVELAATPQEAHYWLVGRGNSEGAETVLEYTWLLPEATVGVAKAGAATGRDIKATSAGVSPLPPLTDWKTKPTDLEDLALRLGKIRAWIKLDSAEGGSGGFAYQLVLKRALPDGKFEAIAPGSARLEEGDKFFLFLVADEILLQRGVKQRHVYIFNIDGAGKSTLFYPNLANNEVDALFPGIPPSGQPAGEINLDEGGLRICGPDTQKSKCRSPGVLGPETYVMLATVEALPDPSVLESDGVRTTEEIRTKGSRGAASPLQDLLTRMGSTSRSGGRSDATPVNWSVQQVFFQSVEKKP